MRESRAFAYDIVDVFTTRPLEGNALAVFGDARGLDTSTMQRIAREFNLAETAFVFPATDARNVARVRIFTPTMEMRFAGHPTIGTAFVLRERGHVPRDVTAFVLEEDVGDVAIRVEPGESGRPETTWLTTPPIDFEAFFDAEACASVLGLAPHELLPVAPQRLSAGNPTIYIAVDSAATVDRAWLDRAGVRRLHDGDERADCVFVFAPTPTGAYARMFAPEHGVVEDPATGSATGPLAAFMMRNGLINRAGGTRFTSVQGVKMGRPSELQVHIRGDDGRDGIDVGGSCVCVGRGTFFPD